MKIVLKCRWLMAARNSDKNDVNVKLFYFENLNFHESVGFLSSFVRGFFLRLSDNTNKLFPALTSLPLLRGFDTK